MSTHKHDISLCRWGELQAGPTIIEAVAATERFRTEALLAEAAEAMQVHTCTLCE